MTLIQNVVTKYQQLLSFESLENIFSSNILLKLLEVKNQFIMADQNLVAIHDASFLVVQLSY